MAPRAGWRSAGPRASMAVVPPRRDRQAGAGHLPRPLDDPPRQQRRRPVHGHPAVPVHRGLRHRARGPGARPGHHRCHHPHRVHDVLRGGWQPVAAGAHRPGRDRWPCGSTSPTAPTSSTAGTRSSIRGRPPRTTGFQTVQGLLALGLGGTFGQGLGHSRQPGGLQPAQCRERLRVRDGGPGAGARRRRRWSSACSCSSPGAGSASRCARRTPSGRCWPSASAPGSAFQAFINIGVVVHLLPRDRHHAAVRELRQLVVAGQLRRGGYPPVDLPRDPVTRYERRCGSWSRPGAPAATSTRRSRSCDPWRERRPDLEVRWLGGRRGLESAMVPAAGYRFDRLWLRTLRTVDCLDRDASWTRSGWPPPCPRRWRASRAGVRTSCTRRAATSPSPC